jgi:pimeloyl-ACP methyl ester carboxylesterase
LELRTGNSLVLIPGIQGRWEYMRPTVEALSRHFDVRTFSLRNDAVSIDHYVQQVTEVLDRAAIERAVVCGVSFGGLIALRFAAMHPGRTRALVLASTPGPHFTLRPRHRAYARLPWIFGPLFLVESPWRLRPEIAAAFPDSAARRAFRREALATVLRAPLSLSAMAKRALLMGTIDVRPDCACITAPTLVVTGEASLDYVVPAEGSTAYAQLIPGARAAVIERTGHIGTITRPDAFAEILNHFTAECGLVIADQSSIDPQSPIRNPHSASPDAAA